MYSLYAERTLAADNKVSVGFGYALDTEEKTIEHLRKEVVKRAEENSGKRCYADNERSVHESLGAGWPRYVLHFCSSITEIVA